MESPKPGAKHPTAAASSERSRNQNKQAGRKHPKRCTDNICRVCFSGPMNLPDVPFLTFRTNRLKIYMNLSVNWPESEASEEDRNGSDLIWLYRQSSGELHRVHAELFGFTESP